MGERVQGWFSDLLDGSIKGESQLAQQLAQQLDALWREMIKFSPRETPPSLESLGDEVLITSAEIEAVLKAAVEPNYQYGYLYEDTGRPYQERRLRSVGLAPIMVDEGGDVLRYPDSTGLNAARRLESITLETDRAYTGRRIYIRGSDFDAVEEKYYLIGEEPNQKVSTKVEFATHGDRGFQCAVLKTEPDGDKTKKCFIAINFSQKGIPTSISYWSLYNGKQVRKDNLTINEDQYTNVAMFVDGALEFVRRQVQSTDPLRAKRHNEIQVTPTYIHDYARSMIERYRAKLQVPKNPLNRGPIINEGLDKMEKLEQKLNDVLSRVDENGRSIPPDLRKKVEEVKGEVNKVMEDFIAEREEITEKLKPLTGDCDLTEATRYWHINHIGKEVILKLPPLSQAPDSTRSLLQIYFQPTEEEKGDQALMSRAEIAARALWWQMIDALCERFDFASWQKMRETKLAVQFGEDSSNTFKLPSGLSGSDVMKAKGRLQELCSRESNQEIADGVNRVIGSLNKVRERLNLRQHEWTFRALGDALKQYGFEKDDIDRVLGEMESEGQLKYTIPATAVMEINEKLLDKIFDGQKRQEFWEAVQRSYEAQRDDTKVKEIEGLGRTIHETAEAWVSLATSVNK